MNCCFCLTQSFTGMTWWSRKKLFCFATSKLLSSRINMRTSNIINKIFCIYQNQNLFEFHQTDLIFHIGLYILFTYISEWIRQWQSSVHVLGGLICIFKEICCVLTKIGKNHLMPTCLALKGIARKMKKSMKNYWKTTASKLPPG